MELNRKPLYRQVADLLTKEIDATMARGDQLESEEKLAKRFSVSVNTIREALWIRRDISACEFMANRG